jgi:hypothetical protein
MRTLLSVNLHQMTYVGHCYVYTQYPTIRNTVGQFHLRHTSGKFLPHIVGQVLRLPLGVMSPSEKYETQWIFRKNVF